MHTENGKPIYFHGQKFADLFEDVREDWRGPGGFYYCQVSGIKGHHSFGVKPTPALQKYIDESMLQDLGTFFKLVYRADDTVLVVASYNQIIGSHWLTITEQEDIPALALS